MCYGIEFRNGKSKDMFHENEIAMHYWGKLSFTVENPVKEHSVFNIPIKYKVAAYCHSRDGFFTVPIYRNKHKGYWVTGAGGWVDISHASGDMYIFVEASIIKSDSYGMHIYSPSKKIVFNSARPMLGTSQLYNATVDHTGKITSSTVSVNYKPAVIFSNQSFTEGEGVYTVAYKDASSYKVGSKYIPAVLLISGNYGYGNSLQIPVINAGYYDQFENLSDYI